MTAILHNHTYNNPSRGMSSQINDADFPLFPEGQIFSQDMYNMANANPHNFNLDPNLAAYSFPRAASQEHYPDFDFASAQLYNEAAPGFANGSPSLYNPIGSPELQGPFRSNISTASAPSASSSTLGSPYLNHVQIAPAIPEWPVEGLGITPTIAGDYGYNTEYSFTSGMDHDFAFADLSMNKPIGFVGECASIPESVSAPRASLSSSASSMHSLVAQSTTINMATTSALERTSSHGSTPRMTQSPGMMSAPVVRRDSRASIFQFNSGSLPLSRSDPVHFFQGPSYSPQSAHRASSSSVVPRAQLSETIAHGHVPFQFHPPPSPFFSQSSGHFVPPLSYSGLFPLSAFLLSQSHSPKRPLTRSLQILQFFTHTPVCQSPARCRNKILTPNPSTHHHSPQHPPT